MSGNIIDGLLKDMNNDLDKLKDMHKRMEFMSDFLDELVNKTKIM